MFVIYQLTSPKLPPNPDVMRGANGHDKYAKRTISKTFHSSTLSDCKKS